MTIFNILLIAVGLSMDSLAVSISSGLCLKRFCWWIALKVAITMGIFQGGMTYLGWTLGSRFERYIVEFDHWVAFLLLLYLGGRMIYESFKHEEKIVKDLSFRTISMLAIATSIDALAVGVSFAFLRMDVLLASVVIGITTFVFSFTGVLVGSKLKHKSKVNVELIGGIILIVIGIKIFFEHTI